MIIAGYRLHLDALLARIVYRWRWKILGSGLALLLLAASAGGFIPPFWRGRAILHIQAADGALVTLNGRPWVSNETSGELYAGAYSVVAKLPDGRRSWTNLTIERGETVDLALPPGLAPLRERQLPPPAPGMVIRDIWRSGATWRIQSATPREETDDDDAVAEPATQTVSISPAGVERLITIDAYRGLADTLTVGEMRYEAVYEPPQPGVRAEGRLIIHGWASAPITLTSQVSFIRFAPDGAALVFAEHAAAGVQISYLARNATPIPLVATPGEITGLAWRPDGGALLIASREGEQRALTLARLSSTPIAAMIAEPSADGLPAHTWDGDRLLWVATGDDGEPWLWQTAISTLLPERVAALDARALAMLDDGALRVVTVHEGMVVIGRWRDGLLVGEAVIHEAPVSADLVGEWQGNELLLRSGAQAWLVTLEEGGDQ